MEQNVAEIIEFTSLSQRLKGQLFFPKDESQSPPAVVMILTGDSPNGTKSKTWPPMIEALLDRDLSVFAFDFQGQGYSGGERSRLCLTVGCRNFVDGYEALDRRLGLRNYSVGILGSSFGGAVLLAEHASIPYCHAIALKSPGSFLAESYETEHGFPQGMEEWRQNGISRVTGLAYTAYLDAIHQNIYSSALSVKAPVLIVHGTADTVVPIVQSRRLCHLLNGRGRLVELPNVNHDYKQPGAQEALQEAVCSFFETRVLRQARAPKEGY